MKRAQLTATIVLSVLLTSAATASTATAEDGQNRYFEIRTYTTHAGMLDALNKRFREHTNSLFKKHGMQLVGYWTPDDEDKSKNTLVYILAYPSRQARDKSWKAFLADSEWQKVYKQSHEDAGGKIVEKVESQFLKPTDYSPIK